MLASWRLEEELRDAGVQAVSELVANALTHGCPPMRLRIRRTDRRLIVEVTDGDERLPHRRKAAPADENGRGITIVATIASAWGSRRMPGGGKSVCASSRCGSPAGRADQMTPAGGDAAPACLTAGASAPNVLRAACEENRARPHRPRRFWPGVDGPAVAERIDPP
ncbi:fermentation-respiration switch protein FrsA (DUF1100 family) [Allostreptomyces psammosilenae]|uniref:Fermentation-respiration switch protein FrsA (DUF1100 family) n=1 Tax=Allostreptomyces psammosilenae TaxID=1892865 RepID=A0A853A3R4_9ACTN|nr:fermentation-respiration switch protein FrsA (DUF1100 family) [Allostreptomyces psammosilenae]